MARGSRRRQSARKLALDVLQDLPPVLEHLFEIVCVRAKNLDIDLAQPALEYLPQDFQFFGGELYCLHIQPRLRFHFSGSRQAVIGHPAAHFNIPPRGRLR